MLTIGHDNIINMVIHIELKGLHNTLYPNLKLGPRFTSSYNPISTPNIKIAKHIVRYIFNTIIIILKGHRIGCHDGCSFKPAERTTGIHTLRTYREI